VGRGEKGLLEEKGKEGGKTIKFGWKYSIGGIEGGFWANWVNKGGKKLEQGEGEEGFQTGGRRNAGKGREV